MIELNNDRVHAEFSALGAQLIRLQDPRSKHDYLWSGDPRYWRFHAPVLFPIVGRLQQDTYVYQGQRYQMPQHGFARESEFRLVRQTANDVVFELTSGAHVVSNYPFKYRLMIDYQLMDDGISVTYQVDNLAKNVLLYSIGAHPAFNVSLNQQREFDDVVVSTVPNKNYSQINLVGPYSDPLHPTTIDFTRPRKLSRDQFSNDAIILDLGGHAIEIKLSDHSQHGVVLQLENAPYVGLWSPYPNQAPFVCIEPWWGIADTVGADGRLDHKLAINQLLGGQTRTVGYQVRLF